MPRTTTTLHADPVTIAVRAIWQNANASDRTPDAGQRQNLNREAAILCRRAADELESRPT